MFERDTEPIIAPRTTKGQGTHLTNLLYDNSDDIESFGETKLKTGDKVYSEQHGIGKVTDIRMKKNDDNTIMFKVVFNSNPSRSYKFYYPLDFRNGKLEIYKVL